MNAVIAGVTTISVVAAITTLAALGTVTGDTAANILFAVLGGGIVAGAQAVKK